MKRGYLSITLCTLLLASSSLLAKESNNKETQELETVTITSEKSSSNYLRASKPGINRNNIKIENIAKSIQVFNTDFINDYQAQSIEEIVTMSSNVVSLGDNNGRENVFAIRGFMNLPILRDGLNIDNAISNPEIYNLEQIEILKGPESLQFGEGGAGGIINLVKKKPNQKEQHTQIVLEANTESKYTTKLDIGGSLNENGSARYRLVSTYSKQNNYRNFNIPIERIFLAPSFAYDINNNHTFTFIAEYLNIDEPVDYGNIVTSKGKAASSYDSINSHPDDEMTSTQKILGFDFNSTFNTWNSSFKYRHVDYTLDMGDTHLPYSYNENTDTLTTFYSSMKIKNKEDIFQYTINKNLELLGTKHDISVGVDYKDLKQKSKSTYDYSALYVTDYSDQYFNYALSTAADHPNAITFGGNGFNINRYGGFVQDSIEFTDKFIANLGLRYDKIDIKADSDNKADKKNATTPSIGFVYKLNPQTTFYTSYSKSFNMQDIRYTDSNKNLLAPEEGIGYEAGIRQKFLDGNLNLSASIFKIEKENVPVYDSSTRSYNPSGIQESKGVEFDIKGEIQPGWSVIASYGYIHTNTDYISRTSNYNKEIVGVPKHSANLFTTYYLTSNMYIGAGARYIGKRYADYANSVKVDDSIVFDASLGYQQKDWNIKFAVKNIANKEYFESVGANGLGATNRNNYLGTPRAVYATFSYSF